MRYLVTGGKGVIASLFARRLISEGHQVTIIDDGNDPRHHANSFEGPLYIPRRLEHMSTSELASILSGCDRVFHAAASTGIPYSATNPLDDWRRNVDGTLALLEALRVEPRPCVVLSSVKPYELASLRVNGGEADSVHERFPLYAEEPYGASKAAQSLICAAYGTSYSLPLVVFRCSNLYGPACNHGVRHGWATQFAIRAALDWPIEIQGDGKQRRDMLHAADVGEAALHAYDFLAGDREYSGEIFNLGGGESNVIGVAEAAHTLRGFGSKSDLVRGEPRAHDDELFVTDHSYFSRATGWKPQVSIQTGLRDVYKWACANREMLAKVYEAER